MLLPLINPHLPAPSLPGDIDPPVCPTYLLYQGMPAALCCPACLPACQRPPAGDIDPAIVPYLLERGMSAAEVDALMNRQSGFLGMTGKRVLGVGCRLP